MKTARISGANQEYHIGKILCIGRNYAEHIRELRNEIPEEPVIFMKPSTAVISDGETIVIPPYSQECHYEVELALLIGKTGRNIPVESTYEYIVGYGVAIDLTLRDVQANLKRNGLPWDIAKGFDTACPLSCFAPASGVKSPQNLHIRLSVNGVIRQDGSTSMMIHSIPAIVSHISSIFTLEPGDIVLTGTPSGVGSIVSGDRLVAKIPGVAQLQVTVQ
ncbi:MAG: fumarylacetoacetate hydrolase family protein [Geobacteraceae bacterium]